MASKSLVCHRCGFEPEAGELITNCPRDGLRLVTVQEHAKAPHDPYLGRVLGGRYGLCGILGEGAMGAVYLALQTPLEREVAVKVIRSVAMTGGSKARELMVQRFLREAQLQADFNHHAVVTVYDFGEEPDGTLYLAMERLVGRPMSHVLPETSQRHLVGMVLQLLDALGRLHEQGLIHRDIKPDNLMVLDGSPSSDGSPRVKLLDFGIAKSLRDRSNQKLTQDGTVFGTPEYMAPEQALGLPDAVDHRADLYAVGAVLYEGFTGLPPFTGSSPLAILHRVVNGVVPPLPDTVSKPLAAVVMRALSKSRDHRFADARAFGLALLDALGPPPAFASRDMAPLSLSSPSIPLESVEASSAAYGSTDEAPMVAVRSTTETGVAGVPHERADERAHEGQPLAAARPSSARALAAASRAGSPRASGPAAAVGLAVTSPPGAQSPLGSIESLSKMPPAAAIHVRQDLSEAAETVRAFLPDDPRDVFQPQGSESIEQEMVRSVRRARRGYLISGVLVATMVLVWMFWSPSAGPSRPVSQLEPVRVTVDARFRVSEAPRPSLAPTAPP